MKPSLAFDAEPEAYAEAMMKCQCYGPACSDAGECALDGWCFGRDGTGFKNARKDIVKLIEGEKNVFVRAWLMVALDGLDHHQFVAHRAFDAMRMVAINKRVRREYGQT